MRTQTGEGEECKEALTSTPHFVPGRLLDERNSKVDLWSRLRVVEERRKALLCKVEVGRGKDVRKGNAVWLPLWERTAGNQDGATDVLPRHVRKVRTHDVTVSGIGARESATVAEKDKQPMHLYPAKGPAILRAGWSLIHSHKSFSQAGDPSVTLAARSNVPKIPTNPFGAG